MSKRILSMILSVALLLGAAGVTGILSVSAADELTVNGKVIATYEPVTKAADLPTDTQLNRGKVAFRYDRAAGYNLKSGGNPQLIKSMKEDDQNDLPNENRSSSALEWPGLLRSAVIRMMSDGVYLTGYAETAEAEANGTANIPIPWKSGTYWETDDDGNAISDRNQTTYAGWPSVDDSQYMVYDLGAVSQVTKIGIGSGVERPAFNAASAPKTEAELQALMGQTKNAGQALTKVSVYVGNDLANLFGSPTKDSNGKTTLSGDTYRVLTYDFSADKEKALANIFTLASEATGRYVGFYFHYNGIPYINELAVYGEQRTTSLNTTNADVLTQLGANRLATAERLTGSLADGSGAWGCLTDGVIYGVTTTDETNKNAKCGIVVGGDKKNPITGEEIPNITGWGSLTFRLSEETMLTHVLMAGSAADEEKNRYVRFYEFYASDAQENLFQEKNRIEGRASFVRVFQQTVQRMIDFGLTGFLVTYSPSGSTNTIQRNPGNEYIDSYAMTVYSESDAVGHIAGQNLKNYYWYVKTGKPVGFSEFSCRTGNWKEQGNQPRASSFDLLADTATVYPNLTWINYWGDGSYSLQNSDRAMAAGNDDGRLFMDSPYTLSLEEIPDYRTTKFIAPGVAQVRLKGESAGVYHGLEEREYSLAQLQAMGIDPTKIESVRANTDYGITFFTEDNCGGTAYGYVGGTKNLASATVAKFKSCRIEAVQNLALDKDAWASDNDDLAYKANDGLLSLWEGKLGADGTAWVYVDLGESCTISKYSIRNAGATQRPDMYNTRAFQIQYSNDAENWTTVSQVKDNSLSVVSRNIQPVTARYFRLLITEPNRSTIAADWNMAMISELELYGVIHGVSQEPDTEPGDTGDDGDDIIEPVIDTDDGDGDAGDEPDTSDDSTKPSGKKRRVTRTVVTNSNTWIVIVCVAAAVVLLGGGIGLLFFLRKRKRNDNAPQ